MLQVKSYSSVLTGFNEYEVIYKDGGEVLELCIQKTNKNKTKQKTLWML